MSQSRGGVLSLFRHATIIVCSLVAGLALTLGVAWWRAVAAGRLVSHLELDERRTVRGDEARWPRTPPGAWPEPNFASVWTPHFGWQETSAGLLHGVASDFSMTVSEGGWPLRAFEMRQYGEAVEGGGREATWVGRVTIGRSTLERLGVMAAHDEVSLPVRPLGWGVAVDTVFYALPVWLLVMLPGAIRRNRRATRGECGACGHPLGGAERCPECGANAPKHVRLRKPQD